MKAELLKKLRKGWSLKETIPLRGKPYYQISYRGVCFNSVYDFKEALDLYHRYINAEYRDYLKGRSTSKHILA